MDISRRDRIRGCMIGGAVGDALGYAVEFKPYIGIIEEYGPDGITKYELSRDGKALFSDDTQMTLFTAEGLLKEEGDAVENIYSAYLNWLDTQRYDYDGGHTDNGSALMGVPELYSERAPGNTCLFSLLSGKAGSIERPINDSKGCGGIMRSAPIAFADMEAADADMLAAKASALTHGHPLGYLSSALFVHIIRKILTDGEEKSLKTILTDSVAEFAGEFSGAKYLDDLISIVGAAVRLSENERPDIENIRALGEGWVAEETLAIAVYSALRYENDFSKCVIAAVNHGGDSDSTGAVAGNIIGAYLGDGAIDPKWKQKLELRDLIYDFADRF